MTVDATADAAKSQTAAMEFYTKLMTGDEPKVESPMQVLGDDGEVITEGYAFVGEECSHTEGKQSVHAGFTAFISAWASYFFGMIVAVFTCNDRPTMPACYCAKIDKETNTVVMTGDINPAVISGIAFAVLGVDGKVAPEAKEVKGKKAEVESPKSPLDIAMADFTKQAEALKSKSLEPARVTLMTETVGKDKAAVTTVTATFDTGAKATESVKLVFNA